ncbi:Sulfite reductase [Phytophthora palmivora]|uniref:Sulfite reductase n=1 Tax=Phytophthora palmivora TaxID=4796 RepID=A0A2P4X7J8_9STRA|nr:Sulfite reductase [Phytophthora palmivora]
MNHRSNSTPSQQSPPDLTKSVPFIPRDVFRLVLRLEAQKALDVNVAALEQRFHVPPGYADDDSLNARGEVKHPKNLVPGPGTYEVPDPWPVRDVTATPTAVFLSSTMRGPYSPVRPADSASTSFPTRQTAMDKITSSSDDVTQRPQTVLREVAPPTRPTKSSRTRLRLPSSTNQQNERDDISTSFSYSSMNTQNASTFSKVGREVEVSKKIVPPVGSYEIKRLWDSNACRTTIGTPSPAVFGASKEKRTVTWRPALTPASYTVSTSWDSSRHYVKQKDKVVRSAAKRRLHSARLHARTLSCPARRPSTADPSMPRIEAEAVPTEDFEDPFSWLRQRPNGEHRVNFLAAKHGLGQHIKSPRRMTNHRLLILSHIGEQVTPGTPSSRLVHQHINEQDDRDVGEKEPAYTAKPKDVRIKVSCRMPGGMLITASVYSMKKLRHFKSAILVRQQRFQTVEQFDLYHVSGRKLTGLEDTLVACGVRDRSTLQIVPAVTMALAHQGNTSVNQVLH